MNVKINAWHLRVNIIINLIMILVVGLQLGLLPWLSIDIGQSERGQVHLLQLNARDPRNPSFDTIVIRLG